VYEPDGKSSADLVRELSSSATLLVKRQMTLAKLEAKRELARGKVSAELLGVAGLCAYAAVLVALVAAALALGAALHGRYWEGGLIVALVLAVPALIVGLVGYRKRPKRPLARTRAEIDKEIAWAKSLRTS
jgi:hypothetical protein